MSQTATSTAAAAFQEDGRPVYLVDSPPDHFDPPKLPQSPSKTVRFVTSVSPGKQNRSDCTGDGPLQNQPNAKPKKQRRGQKRKKAGGNERADKRLHSELEETETAEKKLLSALDAAAEKVTQDEPPAVKEVKVEVGINQEPSPGRTRRKLVAT
jgi:hypothetical protein